MRVRIPFHKNFSFFQHLVSLVWVKLAESVRGKTLSMDIDSASSVPDPVGADGGDDGQHNYDIIMPFRLFYNIKHDVYGDNY